MKLLVVEDEAATAAFLRRGLSEEGFAVDVAADAAAADEAVDLYPYDAILLDVMLPGTDGFTLCRLWRGRGIKTPVLILTARDDVSDRVHGLDAGGDDYLVKPFAFEELLARIRALMRRSQGSVAPDEIQVGDITIDTNRRRVTRNGRTVSLTVREYQLLEYLARHAGKVVTRTALWEHVWESGCEPDSNVVDVYIRYLRQKIGRDPDLIETVRGAGYVLVADSEPVPDASSAGRDGTGRSTEGSNGNREGAGRPAEVSHRSREAAERGAGRVSGRAGAA